METVTKPELAKVKTDLNDIVTVMHDNLKDIDRVDKLVFPLLVLEQSYLNAPDTKRNERLKFYIKAIDKLSD